MYVYSKRNHRKIIHTQYCRYIQNRSKDDLGYFYNKYDAFSKGFRLCKYCSRIGKLYMKQQKAVTEFCAEKNYSISLDNDVLNIITPFSKWKTTFSKNGNKLKLYHRNSIYSLNNNKKHISDYHQQCFFNADLLIVLDYIYNHDKYRLNHPYESNIIKTTKKKIRPGQRSKRRNAALRKYEKKKRKKKLVKLVYTIMDKLDDI